MVGKQKKFDIVLVLASFQDRRKTYLTDEIDQYIRHNVKWDILEDPCYTVDHLRVAMIDFGFLSRDPFTNRYWISTDFEGIQESETFRISKYKKWNLVKPEEKFSCEFCGKIVQGKTMLNHFLKRHRKTEHWEWVIETYFTH